MSDVCLKCGNPESHPRHQKGYIATVEEPGVPHEFEPMVLEPADIVNWLKMNPSVLMEISMTFQLGLAVGSLTALGRSKEWIHKEVDDVISEAEKAKERFQPSDFQPSDPSDITRE